MDRNTLYAVILSTVVIVAGFFIQAKFFPAPEQPVAATQMTTESAAEAAVETETLEAPRQQQSASSNELKLDTETVIEERIIKAETNRFLITFSNKGGIITSLKLKEHLENGEPLEMLFTANDAQGAFDIAFGDLDAEPLSDTFEYRQLDQFTFEFSKAFLAPANAEGVRNPFVLRKVYKFTADDYMMELRVGIENSVNKIPSLNFNGYSYSLTIGPQIGPEFTELDNRYFYRRFYIDNGGRKADTVKIKDGSTELEDRVTWTALAGKYFAAIVVPDAVKYDITLTENKDGDLPQTNEIVLSRPPVNSSNSEDVFKVYFGPKLNKYLQPYNNADENGFSMKDLNLDNVVDSSSILGWLEWLLQKGLSVLYRIIPNYGIAIIILTLFIKVVLFPLTRKSTQSTARMSALSPQLEELKVQYKDQPDKLNKAMSELYKKEGVSPMGGCLPMLIQFPFFIAMYGLLNKYFEFRGAVFIPGWIIDLSAPESILDFGFTIPLVNWTALRLLPIIFVGSQMLSTKITQSNQPSTSANGSQMKMMMYGMPIMFFFILYNAPSGLLVYWICSNLFTLFQQMYTNRHIKPAAAGATGPDLKIVGKEENKSKVVPPPKKKKKKKK
ncbi:MAG: membrane protein insertase YidC [Spirochaetales bacterium]|uniref:Membrane protein insertase YidC n=1 Tax=Candidatus Thalassospirochaeta sargassi TaxID=3119039 RepID=A0AAJ1IDZ5_9SPIO|nr:membrane protein insertase YidC [Spirochaetales bacterium]